MADKFTYNEVKKFIEENTDFKLLSTEYVNCKNKLELECKCGNKHELNFDVIRNLKQDCCPECAIKKREERKRIRNEKRAKQFIKENSEAELLDTYYKDNSTKMRFRCKCGNEFVTTFNHFKTQNKRQCNKCGDKKRTGKFKPFTIDQVRKIIESKDCELITDKYINNTQKLEIRCKCGEIFVTDLAGFKDKNKNRCDKCSKKQSSYSRVIEYYLRENNITFIKEYRFKECRNILPLPFDFYLPKLKTCIEVDGELHYEPSRFSTAIEDFRGTLVRDSIKSDFCKEHKINLIRIPYYEIKNNKYKERINKLIPR